MTGKTQFGKLAGSRARRLAEIRLHASTVLLRNLNRIVLMIVFITKVKSVLLNHSHLMIQSFRKTGLSLKIDGTEDITLDFGDHDPLGPMIPSEEEPMESGSETESEPPLGDESKRSEL